MTAAGLLVAVLKFFGGDDMARIEAFFAGAWIVPVFVALTILFALAMELALRVAS